MDTGTNLFNQLVEKVKQNDERFVSDDIERAKKDAYQAQQHFIRQRKSPRKGGYGSSSSFNSGEGEQAESEDDSCASSVIVPYN